MAYSYPQRHRRRHRRRRRISTQTPSHAVRRMRKDRVS